ncbi:bifunctional amino acid aminotransferase/2-hydroxyacid dehydrogenase [Lactobacillus sp. CBA3605]|uniref:D-2-hydroxyacid dehydrogenase n=1 Tax=Lactobacillus sp. CBA3605 TaxID=2099788 RepID=UPI000CFE248F|nr:D-2-hydroxyacid dehydrogenase [Lactobacillus sp. CBA3605]AVK62059.1 bifunctional amino acid aminotransferase/2-hydroxyacid dehydrogenase [Lactobacillus sp. CBA3605]
MKILMYSVRDDEESAIKAWATKNKVQVDTNELEFHPDTAQLVNGYDGVVIQQRSAIGGDATFYQQLVAAGLTQLTSRTAGVDTIDLPAAKAAGLTVTNVPAYSPNSVAEMAVTQTMRLIRNLELFDSRVSQQNFQWAGLQAREIRSLTVGIIGAGRIGGTVAKLFHGLGAKVIAYDVVRHADLEPVLTYVDSKEALLRQADVVTLHVDLNATSEALIDAAALKLMKSDAFIINASRGPVIVTAALVAALKAGEIAGAALDTVEGEAALFNQNHQGEVLQDPLIAQLMQMPNVILTPHIGFYTNLAVQNMVEISLNDVVTILNGGQTEHAC